MQTSILTSSTDTPTRTTPADVAADIIQRLTHAWAANDADAFADLYTRPRRSCWPEA